MVSYNTCVSLGLTWGRWKRAHTLPCVRVSVLRVDFVVTKEGVTSTAAYGASGVCELYHSSWGERQAYTTLELIDLHGYNLQGVRPITPHLLYGGFYTECGHFCMIYSASVRCAFSRLQYSQSDTNDDPPLTLGKNFAGNRIS